MPMDGDRAGRHHLRDPAGLAGAAPVARCDGFRGIVTLLQAPRCVAISNMRECTQGPSDRQRLYDAIAFSAL